MNSIATIAQSVIDREFPDKGEPGSNPAMAVSEGQLHMLLVMAIRAWRDQDLMPTYSLENRRLALAVHPDADRASGQVVLVASFGEGPGILSGHHELCLCMGEQERKQLIEVLQMPPTIET